MPSLKKKPLRVWEIFKPMPEFSKEDRQRFELEVMYCCLPVGGDKRCGNIAFYRVSRSGFCEAHRAEAIAVQKVYWQKKVRTIASGRDIYA